MDVISIEGVPPSDQLREDLRRRGDPVLLAFSRGKDSIAAWLALREAGVTVVPYHLYLIPRLAFVDESLAYFEKVFQTPIINLPHPSLMRWLTKYVYQPPPRGQLIDYANIAVPKYLEVNDLICQEYGLAPDTWVCDGVRAADSPNRMTAIRQYGPINVPTRKYHAVWDWRKKTVYQAITDAGIDLPADYPMFGRSFDGLDYRFLRVLQLQRPQDYRQVLRWFPFADLEIIRRHDLSRRLATLKTIDGKAL